VGAVLAAALVVTGACSRRPEWTTASPEAHAEFVKGLQAADKLYLTEAMAHYSRALDLDHGFIVAKLFTLSFLGADQDEMRKARLAELKAADLTKLSERERFLVRYRLALADNDYPAAAKILDEFASRNPDDPFALAAQADAAIQQADWARAEQLFSRLIEVAPNQVNSYNQLGYLAMAEGRFAESEKMFQTYKYIAPDQANPHDSLGELLVVVGRYGEAEREFEQALAIKPDFCASYSHLLSVAFLSDRIEVSGAILARARKAAACSERELLQMQCSAAQWPGIDALDWEKVWQAGTGVCAKTPAARDLLRYLAALNTGRKDEVAALAKARQEELDKSGPTGPLRRLPEAVVLLGEGGRLLAEGQAAAAAEKFQLADAKLAYHTLDETLPKLFNRLLQARALQLSGQDDAAKQVLAQVRSVNPAFSARFGPLFGLEP
jgi:Flp pilus assembly protein TadD